MANSATETLLGAAVLIAAGGFLLYANQTAGIAGGTSGNYVLRANFGSAEGINVGSDVRLAGVKIGSVVNMELNPESYQAEIGFAVQDGISIPDDSEVVIASEGLLGGNYVEVSPGGSEFMFSDGDEVIYTQSSVSFLNLMLKFVAGDEAPN